MCHVRLGEDTVNLAKECQNLTDSKNWRSLLCQTKTDSAGAVGSDSLHLKPCHKCRCLQPESPLKGPAHCGSLQLAEQFLCFSKKLEALPLPRLSGVDAQRLDKVPAETPFPTPSCPCACPMPTPSLARCCQPQFLKGQKLIDLLWLQLASLLTPIAS